MRSRWFVVLIGIAMLGLSAAPAAARVEANAHASVASLPDVGAFGDAGYFGSTGPTSFNQPLVGLARTPSSHGYWEVAVDGAVYAFGDARFFGSMGGSHLNQPIVGIAATAPVTATGSSRPTAASSRSATRASSDRWVVVT